MTRSTRDGRTFGCAAIGSTHTDDQRREARRPDLRVVEVTMVHDHEIVVVTLDGWIHDSMGEDQNQP